MHFRSASLWIAATVITCLGVGGAMAQDRLEQIGQFFADANVVTPPKLVDCKLSGGTETTCFSITVKAEPKSYTPGPWCPRTTDDTAESGGIWLEGGEVHDVDGDFIKGLAEFYGDTNWQLYDPETGEVKFTGSLEACEAAARPNVDPEYQNHCVECLPEYMPEDATLTYVIPIEPGPATGENDNRMTGSGVAYNGIRLDAPAPVDAILGAYTIAPFDDCGGHVNPNVGYHYHAVTDCLTDGPDAAVLGDEALEATHGHPVGLAMDGYQIFPHLLSDGTDPAALDACNGHDEDGTGYHYHAGSAGSNAILGCLSAEAGCASSDPDAECDATARPRRP